jgi:hypothetical protein
MDSFNSQTLLITMLSEIYAPHSCTQTRLAVAVPCSPAMPLTDHRSRQPITRSRSRRTQALNRLTIEQYLTYTGISALAVVAYHIDDICGGITIQSRCLLLLLGLCLIVRLQIPQAPRSPQMTRELGTMLHSVVLLGAVFSLGWVVETSGPWIISQPKSNKGTEKTEQKMATLQVRVLHFFLVWWIVSEVEYWRLRVVEEDKNVKYPEYFSIPMDNTWIPRLFPWYPALQYAAPANSTFWSGLWAAPVWIVSLLDSSIMLPWFMSLWTIHYALRRLINPNIVSKAGVLFANGHDTLFTSENMGLGILCMVMVRPVRLLHAALFKWTMDGLCVVVDGRRERRRRREAEQERSEYAFYY